jgi:hypothetical protein
VRREWTDDGQLRVQYVPSTPATRSDVISLQEKLDQQRQVGPFQWVQPVLHACWQKHT